MAPPPGLSLLSADRKQRLVVLQDGLVLMRGAIELGAQQAIVDLVREIGMGPAGFYAPATRGGSMHLQMMCLGRHWDAVTQRYEEVPHPRRHARRSSPWASSAQRPTHDAASRVCCRQVRTHVDDAPVPPMPPALWELVQQAAQTASDACASIPPLDPGVCLVNHYTHGGRLGFHQVHARGRTCTCGRVCAHTWHARLCPAPPTRVRVRVARRRLRS